MSILDQIRDMDQEEFVGIFLVDIAKAFLTMLVLFLIGYYALPALAEGSATLFAITFASTFVVFAYVFKMDYKSMSSVAHFALMSFGYGALMYFFGETIYAAMMAVGILAVVIFLLGDSTLTGIYTYADLKKWVKEKTEKEEKAKQKALEKTAETPTS